MKNRWFVSFCAHNKQYIYKIWNFFWSTLSCFIKSRTFAINIWTIIDIFLVKNTMVNFNTKVFYFINTPSCPFDQFQYNLRCVLHTPFLYQNNITFFRRKTYRFLSNNNRSTTVVVSMKTGNILAPFSVHLRYIFAHGAFMKR